MNAIVLNLIGLSKKENVWELHLCVCMHTHRTEKWSAIVTKMSVSQSTRKHLLPGKIIHDV